MRLAARCQLQRDFSPTPWTNYFDEALDVQVNRPGCDNHEAPQDSFRVYLNNFRPPYAPDRQQTGQDGVSDSEFKLYDQYPTLVMLHGGGYSALTWAQFASCIEKECHCRMIAIDLRSHGDTKTSNDEQMDIDTLVEDVIQVIHETHRRCTFSVDRLPRIILVGHSMGGAIAVKCSTRCLESLPSLVGFVIIDVVEGTAKDALPLMMSVIKTRPNKFPSLSNAIEWSFRSGMAKNIDAARVSMPGNLLNITTGHLAIHDIDEDEKSKSNECKHNITKHKFHISIENLIRTPKASSPLPPNLPLPSRVASLREQSGGFPRLPTMAPPEQSDALIEEEGDGSEPKKTDNSNGDQSEIAQGTSAVTQIDSDGYRKPPNLDESGYCWRTDLAKTQPHWPGWFEGLSQQMLDAPVQGKFLLLAGIDRLDKTLTIGQMQGKFMMKVLPKCGHAVHEDSPERVATEIGQFLVRNKFAKSAIS